jgi:hypothetical protein
MRTGGIVAWGADADNIPVISGKIRFCILSPGCMSFGTAEKHAPWFIFE